MDRPRRLLRCGILVCCVSFGVGLFSIVSQAAEVQAAEHVTVFAAASLTSALEELKPLAGDRGIALRLSLGSSSSLARQIDQGAPADIFISANVRWMDSLAGKNLLVAGTRVNLLRNRLVVVAPAEEPFEVRAEPGFDFAGAFPGRMAVGDPSHVPAGIYAKQALTSLGWWDSVAGRLAPAVDVRAALTFVARGECAAGIVYATDAAVTDRVVVVATLPADSHDSIVYPAALVIGRQTPAVMAAMAFLRSGDAATVFRKYGFIVLGGSDG